MARKFLNATLGSAAEKHASDDGPVAASPPAIHLPSLAPIAAVVVLACLSLCLSARHRVAVQSSKSVRCAADQRIVRRPPRQVTER